MLAHAGKEDAEAPRKIIEFFAHETHHWATERFSNAGTKSLGLRWTEQAWNFLASLLMEGSATLLVSAHAMGELESRIISKLTLRAFRQLLPKAQSL